MNRNQLSLEMCRHFGKLQLVRSQRTAYFVAISTAFGSSLQIEETFVPARNLYSLIAESRRPTGDSIQRIERSYIAGKLGQKNCGSFDCFHELIFPVTSNSSPQSLAMRVKHLGSVPAMVNRRAFPN